MRRAGATGVLAGVGAALCVLAGAAASGAAAPTPVTTTFSYTGMEKTFTVPSGIHSIHVVATGGKGASGDQASVTGAAATVTSDVAVTPGATLYVEVGGNGQNGATATGAFNGGGLAGSPGAGGGGGASDVQTCSNSNLNCAVHDSALVVAAGSGGGGANGADGNGGAGGQQGSAGSNAEAISRTYPATGGGLGTLDNGGTGGSVSGTTEMPPCVYSAGGNQQGGTSFTLTGGTGGAPEMDNDGTLNGGGGGGGGAGYFGGGGGGGGTQVICNDMGSLTYIKTGGAGGGAGASYITGLDSAAIVAKTVTDDTGIPQVSITYTPNPTADLSLKASGPKQLKKGKNGSFKLTVKNNGPDGDSNVAINAKLPKGLKLTGGASVGAVGTCRSTRCTVASLAAGKTATMKLKAKGVKTGAQKLKAKVTGSAADRTPANDSASVTTKVSKPKKHHH